jgi:hypothetical protein
MQLRRSERLSNSLNARYLSEYQNLVLKIQKTGAQMFTKNVSAINKILMITYLFIQFFKNFKFVLTYESTYSKIHKVEIFCEMLYMKSFDFAKEIDQLSKIDEKIYKKFFNSIKKYRKNYETIRYANWEFIESKYNLNRHIMYIINSYIFNYRYRMRKL